MKFEDILGLVFTSVVQTASDEIVFTTEENRKFKLYHQQDCCENVYIESIVGDLSDLVGSPILRAEESTQDDPKASESATWTFYKLATRKGYVDIRFYGESNGYYSESADFREIK